LVKKNSLNPLGAKVIQLPNRLGLVLDTKWGYISVESIEIALMKHMFTVLRKYLDYPADYAFDIVLTHPGKNLCFN
jgi:hypothetical protein